MTGAPRRISPFVARALRALDRQLADAVPRVLGSSDDEAIHDLRVAIRRLRTMLKLVRPVFGRFHTDAVRRAFTDVQRATGDLRDEEVLDETLDAAAEHGQIAGDATYDAWRGSRRARERRLRRAVIAHLRSGELGRARAMLKALLVLPVKPKRDRDLSGFARKCVQRAQAQVEKRRDAPPEDANALHELRIAYKELRYAAELLAGALPVDLSALADPAAKFQKRLGEIHDVDVALVTAKRARSLAHGAQRTLVRNLDLLRAKRVRKYLAEMSPAEEVSPQPGPNGAIAEQSTKSSALS
jgi:CHAD domain-containing protein